MTLKCPVCHNDLDLKTEKKRLFLLNVDGSGLDDYRAINKLDSPEYAKIKDIKGLKFLTTKENNLLVNLPSLECKNQNCGCTIPLTKSMKAQKDSVRPRNHF